MSTKVYFRSLRKNAKNDNPAAIKVYIAHVTHPMYIPNPIYMVILVALNMSLYLYPAMKVNSVLPLYLLEYAFHELQFLV